MPVKVECPHCHISLSVPSKYVGGVAACPQCTGQFQVPAHLAASSTESTELAVVGAGVGVVSAGTSPPTGSAPSAAVGALATAPRQHELRSALPATPAPQSVRLTGTARFITADTAKSTLQPTSDGRLPELALAAVETKKRPDVQAASSNPLLLAGAVAFGIVASVLLLLVDFEPSAGPSTSKERAREQILLKFAQDHHFGCPAKDSLHARCTCDPKPPLLEYQQFLRRAHQAYTRGDYEEERLWYRRVLRLLRQENMTPRYGLTGSENRDQELATLIAEVLRED